MVALHAQRSAPAIRAWAERHPGRGLAVVLTGTDLYGGMSDPRAQLSLQSAQRLIVLQALGLQAVPAAVRPKTAVIYQSTTPRQPAGKTSRRLNAVMVGHLREVKSPGTLFDAARLLSHRSDIHIAHIGAASDPSWAARAAATAAECPNYQWMGELPHGLTRQRIQRAHLLVHTSAAEGGAHVIMEAACSGTPVLASRIPGNVGMLGEHYAGYFEHGDAAALSRLLELCRDTQGEDPATSLLARLRAQCQLRAPLFAPEAERAALYQLLAELQDAP